MKFRQLRLILPFCGTVVLLGACAQSPSAPNVQTPATADAASAETTVVRKSPNDTRSYKYLTLPNSLRVLLVSDPDTEKSAAALSVYRGSFHEPENRPGLAHFLEHMLFIQTHTFPEIDGFQHHISGNGGSSNAYTALDHTNYFFDIRPAAFPEALARFAHFFIDPVLSPEYSAREKNAVHSEYQLQLKDDGWRGYMVGKQALNPDHPGARFTIGSLDTLSGDIHEDLVEFFAAEYSADQMGLVVLSNQSLAELESTITPLFSKIANKNIGPDHPQVPMYTANELPARVGIKALKDGTTVTYSFPMPDTRQHYRKKPEGYFSNLLGHEGEGSLYQFLNARGWIESLSSTVGSLDHANSMLSVSIRLSQSGEAHIDAITDALFQYIDLIKATPPQAWLYAEQARVAELSFRFQEKSNPMGFVYQMAPRLDHFAAEDLLVAPYLMEEFDAELIQQFMSYLRPDNLLMEVSSADLQGDQTEPWFGVAYTLDRGAVKRSPVEGGGMGLPPANPYLPENLALEADDKASIKQLVNDNGLSLWLDTDVAYGAPRANLSLELAVEGGFVEAHERAMAQLYRMLVNDNLSEITYPAYLAGLSYGLNVGDSGFSVSIRGYADKQQVLLSTVLAALQETPVDPQKFSNFKAALIREWRNTAKNKPFQQSFAALAEVLQNNRWPSAALADALSEVSAEDLLRWRDARLTSFSVQGLLHGSVAEADASRLQKLLQDTLPLKPHALARPVVQTIDQALRLQLPVEHDDAAMVLHIQDPDESFASRARSALAGQLLHNAFFRELRTEQQLGYVVSVSNRPIAERGGVSFIVQSPVMSAAGLVNATRLFLDNYIQAWPDLDPDELEQQKLGLINRLTQTPKNLNEQTGYYWQDLRRGHLSFDSRQQVADLVQQLSHEDMTAYFAQLQEKFDQRRLLVFTQGKFADVPQQGKLLSSVVGG
ncbi:MAG: insulinase family protein [Pseudomonadota bacterium]